jgi:WD40 repeat protein
MAIENASKRGIVLKLSTQLSALLCLIFSVSSASWAQQPELVLQTGHSSAVKDVWLSPDEANLVSQSEDRLIFWEVRTQKILREVKNIEAFYVSPDNQTVAAETKRAGRLTTVLTLWDVKTGHELFMLGNLHDWSFSPDGKFIVSADDNGGFRVWDIAAKTVRAKQLPNKAFVRNCVFALQGEAVILSSPGDKLNFVDLVSNLVVNLFNSASWGVTPDGKFLICQSRTNELTVINLLETRQYERSSIISVTFTQQGVASWNLGPDGKYLALLGPDNSVRVLETRTGKRKLEFPGGNGFNLVTFSANGKVVTTREGAFDLDTGKAFPPIEKFKDTYLHAASPTGQTLVSDGVGPTFMLWDVFKGTVVLRKAERPGYHLLSSSFATDGSLLATIQENFIDKTLSVSVWDVQTGQEKRLAEYPRLPDVVASMGFGAGAGPGANDPPPIRLATPNKTEQTGPLAFNQDAHLLVVGGSDGDVVIWNTIEDKSTSVLKGRASVLRAFFTSQDEGLNIYDAKSVRFWDFASGGISERQAYKQPEYTYDNNKDYSQSYASGVFALKDRKTGRVILEVSKVTGCEISADSNLLSCLQESTIKEKYSVSVWDIHQKKVVFSQADVSYGNRFSPDSHNLAVTRVTDHKSNLEVWDIAHSERLLSLPIAADSPVNYDFSPDGKTVRVTTTTINEDLPLIGIGIDKYSFELWSLATRKKIFSTEDVYGDRFNNDWSKLVVESEDRLKLWDFKTQKATEYIYPDQIRELHLRVRELLGWYEIHFSPKEDLVVFYSKKSQASFESYSAQVWNTQTNQVYGLVGHSAAITSASFRSDERYLATSSEDGTIKLWNPNDGTLIMNLVLLNESDWLVTTPEGFFDGTPAAWTQLLWRFNKNGLDDRPVELYFNDFFYPNLFQDVLAGKPPKPPAGGELQKIDRRQPKIEVSAKIKTERIAPPGNQTAAGKAMATVTIEVTDNIDPPGPANPTASSGAQDLRLFRNGSLVKAWHGDVLAGKRSVVLETTIPIVAGENRFTAYAFNHSNIKSADAAVTVNGADTLKHSGTLYVLAIGSNKYETPGYDLNFALADVDGISKQLKAYQDKLGNYARTEIIALTDEEATKANIMLALRRFASESQMALPPGISPGLKEQLGKIKTIEPEDGLVIYYAGHGTAIGEHFYLLAHDFSAGSQAQLKASSISDVELNDVLERVDAGKMLMVIDACQSGQALGGEKEGRGPMNSKGLAQLAYDKGMYILTAAQSYQAAKEVSRSLVGQTIGHGLLTFTLLEGMTKAKRDSEGRITDREWMEYAVAQVPLMEIEEMKKRSVAIKGERGTQLVFVDGDNNKIDPEKRNVQHPRVFYRRELETHPLIVARQ